MTPDEHERYRKLVTELEYLAYKWITKAGYKPGEKQSAYLDCAYELQQLLLSARGQETETK